MPTLRARHTLAETEDLARRLDDAALAWSELQGDRGALLRKLVEVGRASVHVDGGVHALISGATGLATGVSIRGTLG